MSKVRDYILSQIPSYEDFWKHKDLIAFVVCSESFHYPEDEYGKELEPDFDEVIVVVEKDWLFQYMKDKSIQNPLDYLQHEYISDDSIDWLENAIINKKVITISFN